MDGQIAGSVEGDARTARTGLSARVRQIDSQFSTVNCAPVYTRREGLATEVAVGVAEGLKHDSSILCDALVSLPKSALTDFIGSLPSERLSPLGAALRIALALET